MRRVAITGLGAVTPLGNDVNSFFENLLAGVNGIGRITRFDTADFKVKIAAEVKEFDPSPYMSGGDGRKTDLFAQFGIAAAVQAMNDSGLEPGDVAPERLGVYMGSGIGGINTFFTETTKLIERGPSRVSPFFIPMMIANISAGSIAIRYQARGPCLPVVTACATGTHAIGEAYRAIRHGYADVIIAGGSEAAINPMAVAGFTNCMALSMKNDPSCSSIPFDRRRDGFVLGEGGGALILEDYERAAARGAKIYAEVCGYGNTCDAHHITAPLPDAEEAAAAIRIAVQEAGGLPEGGIYINAHGTGTPLNDASETLAIKKALGDRAYECLVSSTKSMTGHMLGAAGSAEAVIAVLALHNGEVPPTIGYGEPDPECDLDYVPNRCRTAKLGMTLSTSLGFGGHNACITFKKPK